MTTTKTFFLIAVVVSLASSPSLALDFSDGQVHDIDYEIEDNVYVDRDAPGMRTTVNLLDGGRIMRNSGSLEAHEDSRINIFAGSIEDDVWIYDRSQVNMSGGSIGWGLAAYGASQVNISGGSIGVGLPGHGTQGEVHILTVVNGLWACAASEVNISGGSIEHDVWIYDSSRVSISGGSIDGDLVLTSSGLLTIHGSDFTVNGQPVGYGGLSSIYEGGPYNEPRRHLTGTLANGAPIDNDFYIGYEAAIVLVPEACESPALLYVDDNAPNDPAPGDPAISDPCENGSMEHPYDAIQEAINRLCHTGVVIVADGLYTGDGNRDIDFLGKAITVRSTDPNDPSVVANTIIDCNGSEEEPHRGFYFHSGEGPKSAVAGFTILGGGGPVVFFGGAVFCSAASPIVYNCIIIRNSAGNDGGGIFSSDGSSPTIANNIIADNTAGYRGGGICSDHSSPIIIGNTITRNHAGLYGGGIWCNDSSLTISKNVIERNQAHCGGGLFCLTSSAIITGNRVTENTTDVHAGGMYFRESVPIIMNNTFTGNFGAGIGYFWSTATIVNNTIAGNETGIGCYESSWTITNCILWENGGDLSGCSATYSCIEDDNPGEGNIYSNPMFVVPGRWDNAGTPEIPWDDFWVDGDYHLTSQAGRWDPNAGRWTIDNVTSPCIDAGDPMTPIGREPFPNGGIINMGAYAGTAEASKSYFGEPPCQTVVAGDINGDCEVNFKDFAIMGLHWLDIPDPDDYVPSL